MDNPFQMTKISDRILHFLHCHNRYERFFLKKVIVLLNKLLTMRQSSPFQGEIFDKCFFFLNFDRSINLSCKMFDTLYLGVSIYCAICGRKLDRMKSSYPSQRKCSPSL